MSSVVSLPEADRPVVTELPELPAPDFWTQEQWDVFYALADGVLPSIVAESASIADNGGKLSRVVIPDAEFDNLIDGIASSAASESESVSVSVSGNLSREALVSFFSHRPSDEAKFREDCVRTLAQSPARRKLGKVLSLLNTRVGSLLLTGYWTPITWQPTQVRHAMVQSLLESNFAVPKVLGKTFSSLALRSFAVSSSIFRELSGYTDAPRNWKAGEGYDYKFIQVPAAGNEGNDDTAHVLEADVVIVGSGCGGGVSAKNLAEAGHDVLVVDKGYYFPPSKLPMGQDAASTYLFDGGGALMTEDGSAGVLSGAAWGGGGTVNWSVCLRTQDFVRREWAEDAGLPLFASSEYDECMDRVWEFVGAGAGDSVRHNHRNRIILEGSAKLGWKAATAPQNTAGKEHYCGQCHLGCGSAEKRGPAVSWLPAAGDAGARFMEGFAVDKVTFDQDGTTATGVEGTWTSRGADGSVGAPLGERVQRRVLIKAKRVILSAGSLWSPLVLMASNVKNPHVGKNLHLHPCTMVTAAFTEDKRPWEGGIITSYNSEFENLDGHGHGVKLEPTCMVPYTLLAQYPWTSGTKAKSLFLNYNKLASFISLTRDRDTGRVFPDPASGTPRIEYSTSEFDRLHTIEGVQALAKLCYLGGATEIQPYLPGLQPFTRDADAARATMATNAIEGSRPHDPEFADRDFAAWLARAREVGNAPPVGTWSSAHQMGTCRMSARQEDGVVDGAGRVWGRQGLYVADASVFPSASGVNPMITTMAIADWVSRGVAKGLSS